MKMTDWLISEESGVYIMFYNAAFRQINFSSFFSLRTCCVILAAQCNAKSR